MAKGKKKAPAPTAGDDDDALLNATIAEAQAEKAAALAAAAAEEAHVQPLTLMALVEKLNTVPMFKVVDDETGDIVPTPDRGGGACMCWYADHRDVQVALAIVKHREPDRKVSIGTTQLGTALAMSEGWGTGLPDAPLRLQVNRLTQQHMLKRMTAVSVSTTTANTPDPDPVSCPQASTTVLRALKDDLDPLPEKLREAMNRWAVARASG